MLFSTNALISLLIGTGLAFDFKNSTTSQQRSCDSHDPPDSTVQAIQRMAEAARANPDIQAFVDHVKVDLDVYFHVVSTGSTPEEGNIPDFALLQQLDVINADYAAVSIAFNLINITRTVNGDWSRSPPVSSENFAMKSALHQGSYKDLNVYFVKQNLALGWCTFPEPNPTNETTIKDGCSVAYTAVPGGVAPYNMGHTLTHEIGHWLSLLHTFQGGCSGGDMVDDTPAQQDATYGCPTVAPDTCPDLPGLDPIHNYMNYSYDVCMNGFTPGQMTRMIQSVQELRGITMNDRRMSFR